jgi:transposase-like protein
MTGESPEQRLTVQGKAVAIEAKQIVLDDARKLIPIGTSIADIAKKHGIAERTLEYWLAGLGDEYIELRRAWIDNLLIEAGELLKDTNEDGNAALRLARARELWKRATWYAERRDRARYGQDAPVGAGNAVQINISLRRDDATNAVQHEAISTVLVDATDKD